MRMMMKVKLDTEAGSRAIADGSLPKLMQETLGALRPEAAYQEDLQKGLQQLHG